MADTGAQVTAYARERVLELKGVEAAGEPSSLLKKPFRTPNFCHGMALRTINKPALATHDEVRDRKDADIGQEDRWEIRSE